MVMNPGCGWTASCPGCTWPGRVRARITAFIPSGVFWPDRFVTSLTNTLVNRFLPATVPGRILTELENRPSTHSDVASAHGLEPYADSESPPLGRIA